MGFLEKAHSAVDLASDVFGVAADFGVPGAEDLDVALDLAYVGSGVAANADGGMDRDDAIGGALGEFAGDKLGSVVMTPYGLVADAVDNLATIVGAPDEVKDVTGLANDISPSNFIQDMTTVIGRGAANMISGDVEGVEKLGDEVREGKAGGPLQGLAMMGNFLCDVVTGEKGAEEAVMSAGSKGEDSILGRAGSWLGDQAYSLLNGDESQQL